MQATNKGIGNCPTDLSNNTRQKIGPSAATLNGTYNTELLAEEAARLIRAHDTIDPMYMYLAFMAVHDGCGEPNGPFFDLGKQAPKATVDLYNTTVLDTYKVVSRLGLSFRPTVFCSILSVSFTLFAITRIIPQSE